MLFSAGSARQRYGRRGTERHAAILRDDIRNATRYQKHRSVVIPFAQVRHSLAQEPTDFAIREDRLEAIANLDAVLAVVNCEQNQNSTRGLFRPNSPLRRKSDRIIFDGPAFQRLDSDDRNLRLCLLIHLGAKRREQVTSRLAQDAGEIIYVALWFRFGKAILTLRAECEEQPSKTDQQNGGSLQAVVEDSSLADGQHDGWQAC